jgi:DNA-binding MarR family transcriptional regulator
MYFCYIFSIMIISNDIISYDNIWKDLKTISATALLIVAIIHLGRLLFDKGEKEVFGPLGMGVNEFEALYNIKHQTSPTPTVIARCSIMPPAQITRVLDRLEKLGAIARHPQKCDRRSYTLSITDKGEALFSEAISHFRASTQKMALRLGASNVEMITRFVIGIIDNVKRRQT